jgi:hypothetical protein
MIHNKRNDVGGRASCPAGTLERRDSPQSQSRRGDSCHYRSVCSTQRTRRSSSIPMPRSNKPSVCCLPPSNASDQPGRRSSIFATKSCSSRAVSASVLMQASCIGCPCSTMLFSRCSAILATPGPSASDAPTPASILMAHCTSKRFHKSSGCFSFGRCMLDT